MVSLNLDAYKKAEKVYGISLPSDDLGELLSLSKVKWYGGKCPVYYVLLLTTEGRMVIGGNYATSVKPRLVEAEPLNF